MSAYRVQVMKFGGTSVGNADCIRRAAGIIAAATKEGSVVVVVSAMGGVTNRLVEAARRSATGRQEESMELAEGLRRQHQAVLREIVKDSGRAAEISGRMDRVITEAENLCRGTALLGEFTPRALDAISCAGERLCAPLVAGALCEMGLCSVAIDGMELIVTDDRHGNAEPLMEATRQRAEKVIRPLHDKGIVPVVTGFLGATAEGTLTTLGRGGSDYSATILGAALGADEVIIWTDVDGVLTADPRLVPEARTLPEISYNEAAEMAYFGAKVLHPKTLRPVINAEVPVWIRNSFTPEKSGTKITAACGKGVPGVKGLTAITDVAMITVGGPGIVGVPDVLARTFAATASVSAIVLLVSQCSSQNDICFVVHAADTEPIVKALRKMLAAEIAHHEVEHVNVDGNVAVVAAVGENMRGAPGIAGRIFNALGREAINIIAIAQGSSEYNISFVVEAGQIKTAVACVHREFGLG